MLYNVLEMYHLTKKRNMEFVSKLKINIILAIYQFDLTEWESSFLDSLSVKKVLSDKQKVKLDEIWQSLRAGNRSNNPFDDKDDEMGMTPYSSRLGLSYDDVHDFDK